MKLLKYTGQTAVLILAALFTLYFSSCSDNVSPTDNQTDDQYLQEIVTSGYSTNREDDDNLSFNETTDLDDGGAVGMPQDNPIDSLKAWGRKILSVNVDIQITNIGDSLKNVIVTRNITGEFHIIWQNNGQNIEVVKPYTETMKRTAVFKRVARTNRPRFNWRLYEISMLDGNTVTPQLGTDKVMMNKIEVYVNGTLKYTFTGPDFTNEKFITRKFNGAGIPEVNIGDEVRLKVYTYSTDNMPDFVAWHWAKNAFGFHWVPFTMTSNVQNGSGWDRTYEKTFNVFTGHIRGAHNGFISASTWNSLLDDDVNLFASDLLGIPYRVRP